jgi:hypothetical protein
MRLASVIDKGSWNSFQVKLDISINLTHSFTQRYSHSFDPSILHLALLFIDHSVQASASLQPDHFLNPAGFHLKGIPDHRRVCRQERPCLDCGNVLTDALIQSQATYH